MQQTSRRLNPLTGNWILLSPHRMSRPWTGKTESVIEDEQDSFDASCFLCPGNKRMNGDINDTYTGTYVFPNDFAALAPTKDDSASIAGDLFTDQAESGVCEVVCYSEKHNKSLMHMNLSEAVAVVRTFTKRYQEIGANDAIAHVQIFESRGKEVGNSNLHPHAQIWSQSTIPHPVQMEIDKQVAYQQNHNSPLLLDYCTQELEKNERVIYTNDDFAVVVPFWAEWPYEVIVLPRFVIGSLTKLTATQQENLARCLILIPRLYATLFERPRFGSSYMMGIHQLPTDGKEYPGVQLHLHYISPMLTPTRQKFQAGYEKYAEPQRDLTPERAAEELQAIATTIQL